MKRRISEKRSSFSRLARRVSLRAPGRGNEVKLRKEGNNARCRALLPQTKRAKSHKIEQELYLRWLVALDNLERKRGGKRNEFSVRYHTAKPRRLRH